MKYTLNQVGALSIMIVSLVAAIMMLFVHIQCSSQTEGFVESTLAGIMLKCGSYLWGSTVGSQNKDESAKELQSQMVDALKNSTPATTKN